MARVLFITRPGAKEARLTIPDDARVTFGPFSPPAGDKTVDYGRGNDGRSKGTLRVYAGGSTKATESVLAVITGVESFFDTAVVDFEEAVATEEVRKVWKSDASGYRTETVANISKEWVDPTEIKALPATTAEEQF